MSIQRRAQLPALQRAAPEAQEAIARAARFLAAELR
jgi:hypothetical protein